MLAVPAFCLLVAVIGFALGQGISRLTLPLATVLAFAFTGVAATRWLPHHRTLAALLGVAVTAAVVGVAVVGSDRVWDTTWDGQWFHQEAVLQLAGGWNPWAEPLTPEEVPREGARARINGYPAASWIYGATILATTGRLETAKAFSPVLMVAAFLLASAALLDLPRLPHAVSWLLALVLALNPVAVTQFLNFQHDGDLVSALLAAAAAGTLAVRRGWPLAICALTMAGTLTVGIKLTGPAFLGVLLAALATAYLLLHRRLPRRRTLTTAAVVALAVAATGFHPYVTNGLRFGHPLYPHAGPQRLVHNDIEERGGAPLRQETPVDSGLTVRPLSLLLSAFSRSSHAPNSNKAYELLMSGELLKVPFTVDAEERQVFLFPDVRIGGWGPLFGGMVLLALLTLIAGLRRRRTTLWVGLVGTTVLASALLVPTPWLARYTPQIWWLPLLVVPSAFGTGRRLGRGLAVALLAATATNIALVVPANVLGAYRNTGAVRSLLLDLAGPEQPLRVHFGPFRSYRARLTELGIPHVEVQDPRFSLGVPLGYLTPPGIAYRLVPRLEGGLAARLSWARIPVANHYRIEVVEPPPRGPGGGALTVVEREVQGTILEIPLPIGTVHLLMTTCNELGCGPPDLVATIDVPPPAPPEPVFGSPAPRSQVDSSTVLFTWIPPEPGDRGPQYRLRVRPVESGDDVLDITTDDHFWAAELPPGQELEATVTAYRDGAEIGDDLLRFRTGTPLSPRPLAPIMDSTLPEGRVVIAWSTVPGANRYDYYVAVLGEPEARLRGETAETSVAAVLPALDDRATTYSVTVRACRRVRCTAEEHWGPWSIQGGTGVTNFTVVPAPP